MTAAGLMPLKGKTVWTLLMNKLYYLSEAENGFAICFLYKVFESILQKLEFLHNFWHD